MKKSIKLISVLAAGLLALNATAFADFSDMPQGQIGASIQAAVDNGLITGYEDGTVRPDGNITRAEMAAIIVRAMGATEASTQTFPDVASTAWYADTVSKAVAMGAFKGDTAGNFNPENNITCQETYTVLSRVFCFEGYDISTKDGKKGSVGKADAAVLDAFADKASVASWAVDYAAAVVGNGGFAGFDGQLKGDAMITRGEFALLMDTVIGTYIDEPGTYTADKLNAEKSIVVRKGGVTIDGLKTGKNLIIAYSVDTAGVKVTNAEISGVTAVFGAADPVNKTVCASIQGTFKDVRVGSAWVTLDASGAAMQYYKGVKDSIVNMGTFGG